MPPIVSLLFLLQLNIQTGKTDDLHQRFFDLVLPERKSHTPYQPSWTPSGWEREREMMVAEVELTFLRRLDSPSSSHLYTTTSAYLGARASSPFLRLVNPSPLLLLQIRQAIEDEE